MFGDESSGPRAVVGRILGAATLLAAGLLLVMLASTGHISWQLVTLVGVLWAAWGFIGGLFNHVIDPAARFLANQLTGNVSLPKYDDDIVMQTARLERLLEQVSKPHHEILIGIRLAEIYRTHQQDPSKSDALLARLRAKYPEAPELALADPG